MRDFKTPRVGEEFELTEDGSGNPAQQIKVIGTITYSDGDIDLRIRSGGMEHMLIYRRNKTAWGIAPTDANTGLPSYKNAVFKYSLKPVRRN